MSLSNKKQINELESKLSYINFNYDILLKFDDDNNNSFTIIPKLKGEGDCFEGPKYEYPENEMIDEELKGNLEEDFNNLNDNQKLGIMFLLLGVFIQIILVSYKDLLVQERLI